MDLPPSNATCPALKSKLAIHSLRGPFADGNPGSFQHKNVSVPRTKSREEEEEEKGEGLFPIFIYQKRALSFSLKSILLLLQNLGFFLPTPFPSAQTLGFSYSSSSSLSYVSASQVCSISVDPDPPDLDLKRLQTIQTRSISINNTSADPGRSRSV
ncbi:hypothetical protein AAC387_Pa03g2596 [Persea americana]